MCPIRGNSESLRPEQRIMVKLYSRAGAGGEFFCIDNTNLAGDPLQCPGGYHTGTETKEIAFEEVIHCPKQSVPVVKMSAPLVNVSAMVSLEYRVIVNMPGQLEGKFNILNVKSCFPDCATTRI